MNNGRQEVRAAVTSFLTEAKLPYVGIVHPARPGIMGEQDYEANRMGEAVQSENGSSGVLVINLPEDTRRRRAATGRGAANDTRIYKVALEVYFASTSGSAIKAQEDYDQTIDAIVNEVRANPTLGDPDAIWSAGEYEAGVQHQQGEPYTDADGLTVFIFGAVQWETWQWIAETVV